MWMPALVIALALVAAAALFWGFWQRHRRRQRLDEERERHRRELEEVRREARSRIDRLERQLAEARERGHLEFAADLLDAVDALDRADAQLPSDLPESVRGPLEDGLAMVRRQLRDAFGRHGLEPIDPAPEAPFDPQLHEAWGMEEREAVEGKEVLRLHRRGWRFDQHVVRAAGVDVAVAASGADDESDAPSDIREPEGADHRSDAESTGETTLGLEEETVDTARQADPSRDAEEPADTDADGPAETDEHDKQVKEREESGR